MADIINIPVSTSYGAQFKFNSELSGTNFIFLIEWNTRFERWFMSIFDTEENPLLMGIPMHVNTDLIGRFPRENLPAGTIILFDTSETEEECAYDDLGDRCILLYRERE